MKARLEKDLKRLKSLVHEALEKKNKHSNNASTIEPKISDFTDNREPKTSSINNTNTDLGEESSICNDFSSIVLGNDGLKVSQITNKNADDQQIENKLNEGNPSQSGNIKKLINVFSS